MEPQKFFIGLIDFFSILLPGALLTYFLKDSIGESLLGKGEYTELVKTQGGWIAFLFSSYLLGHFIFLIGSYIDDLLYDPLRKGTSWAQIVTLAKGNKLSLLSRLWLAKIFFRKENDEAVRSAESIKAFYLDKAKIPSGTINTFQWCKARLALEHNEALADVQRYEADSKFFRSLIIVLLMLIIWGYVHINQGDIHKDTNKALIEFCVPLLVLAFLRYTDQRLKSTNQAYRYIITLEGKSEEGFHKNLPVNNLLSHAGGVVFRKRSGRFEYLLVQAKYNPNEWVLPKGHIEPGETMQQTAVREVIEETGVWARVLVPLDIIEYSFAEKQIRVQFYLMEAVREKKPKENREHRWFSYDEALKEATHAQSKKILETSEEKRKEILNKRSINLFSKIKQSVFGK